MSGNPTEDNERDISSEKEQFLRSFMTKQRELNRQSWRMVANLAQANTELILANGLNEVAAKKSKRTVRETQNEVTDNLLKQRVKRENMADLALTHLQSAINDGLGDGDL